MTGPHYLLGHSDAELERLRLQSALFDDITRQAFTSAGLRVGWRVLDIGCGGGDVSLLVAAIVGDEGSVVGIDRSTRAISAARERAHAAGRSNLAFHVSDITAFADGRPFDAVVGRFVLMHQADAAATVRAAARQVRPGGVVVVIESAFSACVAGFHSQPHSPTYDRMLTLMQRVLDAAGADARMGLRLRQVFTAAGLSDPHVTVHARVDGGADAIIYRYMADSLRSVLPFATSRGLLDAGRDDIARLEAELRAEVLAGNGALVSPPLVVAWSRTPADLC